MISDKRLTIEAEIGHIRLCLEEVEFKRKMVNRDFDKICLVLKNQINFLEKELNWEDEDSK